MFREEKKFLGPQKYQDIVSGISVPDGLSTNVSTEQNFSHVFGVVGDVMLRDGEQIPLFSNQLDIATDAQNATSVGQVVSIATNSLVNNQQLNRCEILLPFEKSLYFSSFRRATLNSTTVSEAIQACVNELNKIYIPIIVDSNRKIFEVDGISARNLPPGDYRYQTAFNLSMDRGVIYAASANDETVSPITSQLTGIHVVDRETPDQSDSSLAIISDNTIRFFTRCYEKPPTTLDPFSMTIPLTGGTYQSIVNGGFFTFPPLLYSCNTSTLKLTGISPTDGSIVSNLSIDTKANNNLPIIGIVNLVPQVMECPGGTFIIAEQGKNAIVQMPEGNSGEGDALSGWTYFPHPVLGISTTDVAEGNGMTVLYENPLGSDKPNLASRTVVDGGNFSVATGGTWTFSPARTFAVATGGSATVNGAVTVVETRSALLWNTSTLNASRLKVLKVRITGNTPFARNTTSGGLVAATVEIHQFTTATPGVVVNGDLDTGVGAILGTYVIPYTNQGNTGLLHPPPDTDGVVRGDWAFDLPVSAINTTGFTGLFIQLTGFASPGTTIGASIGTTLRMIIVASSDISSTTPTTFLSNFPADGTSRYEERQFSSYTLDKQQEFEVPIKNVKQICSFSDQQFITPKVRVYGVEFPRFTYVNNSTAKTNNGSTYVVNSYSSPYLTAGRSMKIGEFYNSRSNSTLTTETKRLILTFDRLNYWFHSMRLINGKCKLQIHIQSYVSRLIDNGGTVSPIPNPNGFSLLAFLEGTDPEDTIKVINGGTIFKTLPRNMALDTDGDGVVTESDLGRNYIVEYDVTDFMVSLRETDFSSIGFIFRNENENQFFTLASGNDTIVDGEISSTVEIFDELAPRLIFTDESGELLLQKNGYKSASMPRLTPSIVVS